MFREKEFGLAVAITGSVMFLFKHLVMWGMWWGGMMPMRGMMMRGVGMMMNSRGGMMEEGEITYRCLMSWGNIFWGFFLIFIFAFLFGWFFARVYNKLAK